MTGLLRLPVAFLILAEELVGHNVCHQEQQRGVTLEIGE